jgi:hypothetical protein
MAKRGKVLRDPYAGPGLMIVEGQQHPFFLEGVWQSEVPPKPGLAVEVEFDSQGTVSRITAVRQAQLAKGQAEMALAAANKRGTALAWATVGKFGLSQIVAAGLLIFSWWFLPAASIEVPFLGKLEFTLWQLLGYLNAKNLSHALQRPGNPSSGFYGLLALIAVVAPFIHHYWTDRRALLGALSPLLFILVIGILLASNLQGTLAGPNEGAYQSLQRQAQEQFMQAVSVGVGTYLSMLLSLYFAALGVKNFLAAKAIEPSLLKKPRELPLNSPVIHD